MKKTPKAVREKAYTSHEGLSNRTTTHFLMKTKRQKSLKQLASSSETTQMPIQTTLVSEIIYHN